MIIIINGCRQRYEYNTHTHTLQMEVIKKLKDERMTKGRKNEKRQFLLKQNERSPRSTWANRFARESHHSIQISQFCSALINVDISTYIFYFSLHHTFNLHSWEKLLYDLYSISF